MLSVGDYYAFRVQAVFVSGISVLERGELGFVWGRAAMTSNVWDEDRARDAAGFLHAIAHPKRLLLLMLLAERQLPASKLARAVGVSQPAAFRHLRRLVEIGILSVNPKAASMTFAIASPETLQILLEMRTALSVKLLSDV